MTRNTTLTPTGRLRQRITDLESAILEAIRMLGNPVVPITTCAVVKIGLDIVLHQDSEQKQMSAVKSIEEWALILRVLRTSMADPAEIAVAHRIFRDLLGYRHSNRYRHKDASQLSNAMQAYARIVQEAGVKA